MRCEEFEARLNDLLDLRLDPAEDHPLQLHARKCDDCQALLSSYVQAVTALESMPSRQCDDDLPRLVLAQWSVAPSNTPRGVYAPHLVAAAALLIVSLVVLRSTPEHVAPASGMQLAKQPITIAVPHPVVPDREVAATDLPADEEEISLPGLHDSVSGMLTDVAELWPALPDADPMLLKWDEAESLLAMTTMPMNEPMPVVMELAGGLKPITDSTDAAIQFLLDVFSYASAVDRAALGVAPAGASPRAANEAG
jgi:hypothetical protein